MARHVVKITFLLMTGLITAGLLSFMLVSDGWIGINRQKLSEVEKKFETQFQIYSGQKANNQEETKPTTQTSFISVNTKINKITRSTSTSTTTTTTPMTTTTVTVSTKTHFKSSTKMNDHDSENHDHDAEQEVEENDESEAGNHDDENLDYEQEDSSSSSNNNKRLKRSDNEVVDYVYLTKLWPLVKYKSLYSECIEYKKLNLKISSSFLIQPNKEFFIGTINYGKLLDKRANESLLLCDAKVGMIKCLLSQSCVHGKLCDGITDCDDQTDEQFCETPAKCQTQHSGTAVQCDNRCWQYWNKCDKMPNCFDLSDEISPECAKIQKSYSFIENLQIMFNPNSTIALKASPQLTPFTFGQFHYDKKQNCFVNYFDFKSAQLIRKENLKYLTQSLADHIQDVNNINYNLQLIYSLAFVSALVFTLLALLSLVCVTCFKKVCFQCPFWFYGFFAILAWLSCFFGLMTFMFQCFSAKHKAIDPLSRMPIENELIRLNPELIGLQELGITFWIAVSATCVSFLASFISCIVCCNLPTLRHEDKEYQIMQLPTYS